MNLYESRGDFRGKSPDQRGLYYQTSRQMLKKIYLQHKHEKNMKIMLQIKTMLNEVNQMTWRALAFLTRRLHENSDCLWRQEPEVGDTET